jgi:16S rRNA (cytosine967-C5)-methyltransferase
MSAVGAARAAAFLVLKLVEDGGHSDELLLRHTALLESRDAALAYELVLGSLRRRLQLRYLASFFGAPPAERLDLAVRLALDLGFYQLRFLDRIPNHAAVAESVELVKRAGKRSAAGLVNAVLRKDKGQAVEWPSREIRLSTPEWLLARWGDRAETVGAHSLTVPPSGMDPGSRSIVPLLDLRPGQSFLDLCAAPGNKTRLAIQLGPALVVACDRSAARLETVPGQRVQLDASQSLPFRRVFDRILVDAPCSGTGTLARNPEIKWRLTPLDIIRQQQRQRRVVASALQVLAPGGRLVYSTCSLEPEENEHVAEPFQPLDMIRRWPGDDEGDGFFAAILESR